MGLFRMRFGEESEGMRGWMNTALQAHRAGTGRRWVPAGSAWVMLPSSSNPWIWGTQEMSKPHFSPQHSQRTHPDTHEWARDREKMSWENITQPAARGVGKRAKEAILGLNPSGAAVSLVADIIKHAWGKEAVSSCSQAHSQCKNTCMDGKGLTPTLCYPENTQTPGAEGAAAAGHVKLTIFSQTA